MAIVTSRRGRRVQVVFKKPSRTKQSFKDECDINVIMRNFQRTGMVAHLQSRAGIYADVSGSVQYHDALNLVLQAQTLFDALPSALRARFQNDPRQFLEFVENPANKEELVKLGLTKSGPVVSDDGAAVAPSGKGAPKPVEGSEPKPAPV